MYLNENKERGYLKQRLMDRCKEKFSDYFLQFVCGLAYGNGPCQA